MTGHKEDHMPTAPEASNRRTANRRGLLAAVGAASAVTAFGRLRNPGAASAAVQPLILGGDNHASQTTSLTNDGDYQTFQVTGPQSAAIVAETLSSDSIDL